MGEKKKKNKTFHHLWRQLKTFFWFILYLHPVKYCTLVDVIHDIGVWPWDFKSKLRRSCTIFQPPGYCVVFMLYLLYWHAFSTLEPLHNAVVYPPMILLQILVPVCDDWEVISVYCTDQNKVICMTLWRYLVVLWGPKKGTSQPGFQVNMLMSVF